MKSSELRQQIHALKEERTRLYPRLNQVKAEISRYGNRNQPAPDDFVETRDKVQFEISRLSLEIEALQLQLHEAQEAEKATLRHQANVRQIVCAILANPNTGSLETDAVISGAVRLDSDIRTLSL